MYVNVYNIHYSFPFTCDILYDILSISNIIFTRFIYSRDSFIYVIFFPFPFTCDFLLHDSFIWTWFFSNDSLIFTCDSPPQHDSFLFPCDFCSTWFILFPHDFFPTRFTYLYMIFPTIHLFPRVIFLRHDPFICTRFVPHDSFVFTRLLHDSFILTWYLRDSFHVIHIRIFHNSFHFTWYLHITNVSQMRRDFNFKCHFQM